MKHLISTVSILALGACWATSSTTTTGEPKHPPGPDVSVELSSVTLADDCGEHAAPPPPPVMPAPPPPPPGWTPPANVKGPAAGAPMPPASSTPCQPGGPCGSPYRRACEQTSMQLRITNRGAGGSQEVRVGRVELLDDTGKRIGELVPRDPMRWSEADGQYAPWNQLVDGGKAVAVTYTLSSPAWHDLPGGRWDAHAHTYQLRVKLVVGSKERTVEKDAITVAMIEPPVPT